MVKCIKNGLLVVARGGKNDAVAGGLFMEQMDVFKDDWP